MIKEMKMSPHVKVIPRGDRLIYINPNIPRWIVTDKIGELILSMFDGTNTYEQIVETAIEGFGRKYEIQIRRFCNHILSSGLLDNVAPQHKQHRMVLSSVHLSLSDSCNLSCSYCYAKARQEKGFPKLTLFEYKNVIDDIISINPNVIFTLTGGEPLLNKDCFDIASYIKSKKCKVFLLSNGTLFNEKNIDQIVNTFDLITLSLDGPNEKIHAKTRGKNNYNKVISAIELLDSRNAEFTLSMTVTKQNIGFLEDMAKIYGSKLNFAPFFPVLNETSDFAISGREYYNALKSAFGVRPLSYCESSLEGALVNKCQKCAIGDGEFSISATGDVYPCQLLHSDAFLAGNVHKNTILEIYYNSSIIDECSHLEVDNIKGCKDCPIKYICGGSCRARSFYENGDIQSSSDFCEYELEAFLDGIVSIYSHNVLE